jgi:heat shock protein HslJ
MDDDRLAALLREEFAAQVAVLETDDHVQEADARFDAAVADLAGRAIPGDTRGRTGRRSRWLLPVAAAVVGVLVVAGVAVLSARRTSLVPSGSASPAPSASVPASVTALLGTWLPAPGQTVTGYGTTQGLGGTLVIVKGGIFGGTDACNSYGGKYVADDHGTVTFGSAVETAVGCVGGRDDGGLPILLSQVKGWAVASGRLTLLTRQGKAFPLDLVRADDALMGAWHLTQGQRVGGPTFADSKLVVGTLTFTSATSYTGQVGCNTFMGTYRADDSGAVTFDPPMITDAYCPLAAGAVSLADLVDEMSGWTTEYNRLVLTGGSPGALTFQR